MIIKGMHMRVFDVCFTLYASNTTFDFITQYHQKAGNKIKFLWCKVLLSLPFKILNKFKLISLRENFIYTLKGESKDKLFKFSTFFVDDFLKSKENETTMKLLLSNQSDSILISASLDPVIDAIAKKLSVTGYSSKLQYKNGYCTGRLEIDLKGNKHTKIIPEKLELVVTDNMSDINLIKNSQQSYIVTRKNNNEKWLVLLSHNNVDLGRIKFL